MASSSDENTPDDDSWNEEEDLKGYRRGGYNPVSLGDQFDGGRYSVLSKLGWGHFSTVWLAWDSVHARPTVLKFQKSAARYSEAAKDEVELLRAVGESPNVEGRHLVLLHGHFLHRGVNGAHHVMVFEVLGPTVLSLIKQTEYHGMPLAIVRRIAKCVLTALAHLHEELSIIHTDLKPENILCVLSPCALDALVARARNMAAAAVAARDNRKGSDDEGEDGEDGEEGEKGEDGMEEEEEEEETAAAAATANTLLISKSAGGVSAAGEVGVLAAGDAARAGQTEPQKKVKVKQHAMSEANVGDEEVGDGAVGADGAGLAGSSTGEGGGRDPRIKTARTRPIRLEKRDALASALQFKVADLGNACWRTRQFTDDIQTRQYRSPEVILGAGYDTAADMWSLACVLFEAATGDLLFSPKAGIPEALTRLPEKCLLNRAQGQRVERAAALWWCTVVTPSCGAYRRGRRGAATRTTSH